MNKYLLYTYIYRCIYLPEDVPLVCRVHGLVDFVDDAEGRRVDVLQRDQVDHRCNLKERKNKHKRRRTINGGSGKPGGVNLNLKRVNPNSNSTRMVRRFDFQTCRLKCFFGERGYPK